MITRTTRLPPKRPKVKSGIKRGPQRIFLRHRKFIRSHTCCVPGCASLGVPDPAHLRGVNNAGAGLKPGDWFLVPLCRLHHIEQEAAGPDTFGDRHGVDLWALAEELSKRSPDLNLRLARDDWELQQPGFIGTSVVSDTGQDKTDECPGADHAQLTPSAGGKHFLPVLPASATGISPANDDTPSPIGIAWFAVKPGGRPEMVPVLARVG